MMRARAVVVSRRASGRNATDDLALHSNVRRRHIWADGRTDGRLSGHDRLSLSFQRHLFFCRSLCHVISLTFATSVSPLASLPNSQAFHRLLEWKLQFVAASVRRSIDFPDQYCRRTNGCHWRMRNVRCPLPLPSPPGRLAGRVGHWAREGGSERGWEID